MIEWLEGHGVDHIVFACGFLPDRMREVLGDGDPGGARFTWIVEPEPLDTAGAIRFALPHLDQTFLALNGDSLADLDLGRLWQAHHDYGAKVTLGLHPVEDSSHYGLVDLADDGQVTGFHEKPDPGEAGPGLISAGVYVLDRDVIAELPDDRSVSIEREVFPALVSGGLYACRLDGYWMDIGTPERFLAASWDIVEGRVRTGVPVDPRGVMVDPENRIDPAAEIGPRVVIGPGCEIAPGARITDSVLLGENVIGAGATVSGSILSPGAFIEPGAAVTDAVLGRGEAIYA